jgi:hypothetical protein
VGERHGDDKSRVGHVLSDALARRERAVEGIVVKELGITNAKLGGGIAKAKVSNSSVTVSAGDGVQNGRCRSVAA